MSMLFVIGVDYGTNARQTPRLVGCVADAKGGDAAVFHLHQAVGSVDDFLVVRGEDEGCLQATVDLLHQAENFPACCLVEIGSRFVGEDDAWFDG